MAEGQDPRLPGSVSIVRRFDSPKIQLKLKLALTLTLTLTDTGDLRTIEQTTAPLPIVATKPSL